MVQKISGAAPGSTVVIDDLYPNTYKISVLAYKSASGDDDNSSNPTTFTYDLVTYYGMAAVTIHAGEEKSVALAMKPFKNSGSYPVVKIYPTDRDAFHDGSTLNYSCTVTGNGVNFTYTGRETSDSGKENGTMNPDYLNGIANYKWYQKKETFLEPGFAYTFNVTVTKEGWEGDTWVTMAVYTGSAAKVIEQSNYDNQNDHTILVYVR